MMAWANIRAIVKRELGGYFTSPIAYVFLVIFLLLAGFFTFTVGSFFERGEASLVSFFTWHPWLYLFLVPAVGMRLWSEERRLGTIELLLTMPITPWQASSTPGKSSSRLSASTFTSSPPSRRSSDHSRMPTAGTRKR